MSAFTRLYYANRGPGGFGVDDRYDHPFEDTFHDPPVPIVPEDSYDEPAPTLWGGPEPRLPRTDPRYATRNPT
jgi:hypothetical protein